MGDKTGDESMISISVVQDIRVALNELVKARGVENLVDHVIHIDNAVKVLENLHYKIVGYPSEISDIEEKT